MLIKFPYLLRTRDWLHPHGSDLTNLNKMNVLANHRILEVIHMNVTNCLAWSERMQVRRAYRSRFLFTIFNVSNVSRPRNIQVRLTSNLNVASIVAPPWLELLFSNLLNETNYQLSEVCPGNILKDFASVINNDWRNVYQNCEKKINISNMKYFVNSYRHHICNLQT